MGLGLSNAFIFWKLFRESDFGAIDRECARSVRITTIGTPESAGFAVASALRAGSTGVFLDSARDPDLVLSCRPFGTGLAIDLLEKPHDSPIRTVVTTDLGEPAIVTAVVPAIVDWLQESALALARRAPVFRQSVAGSLIRDTSLGNAQTAALTNLADVLPVIGPFVGSATDLLMLTKNQVMLVYKLAAIHGRSLGSKRAIIAEIAPVLGTAFLWRTLARQLAGLMPFGLGIVPKVVVAYTGTYVAGQVANYYFTNGRKPPKSVAQQFQRDAVLQFGKIRSTLSFRRSRVA